jgi:hypothetical protein
MKEMIKIFAEKYGKVDDCRRVLDRCDHLSLFLDSVYRANNNALKKYKDIHKGERCFIIGNGPSLKGMDLQRLRNEITFGTNRIYLLYDELGFKTSYYVCMNRHVNDQFNGDIAKLGVPKFVKWDCRHHYAGCDDMHYLSSRRSESFHQSIDCGIWEGATVTYAAMQLAYYMGFKAVVLVGVDHNFTTQGDPHKLVVESDEDNNHFHPNYFGKGCKWQLPDLETSERAYRLARAAYEADGRSILDATVDGKLNVFDKVKFANLF